MHGAALNTFQRSLGENGWTGGQYSVFRMLLGGYLLAWFVGVLGGLGDVVSVPGLAFETAAAVALTDLFPNILHVIDKPVMAAVLGWFAVAASVAFMLGWRDRMAALVMCYVIACLVGGGLVEVKPSLPYVWWMLLATAWFGPGAFGSLAARGRIDPDGGWAFPPVIYAAAWLALAVGYGVGGYLKFVDPAWIDGLAVRRMLEGSAARPTPIREWLLAMPVALKGIAWGGIALELLFLPLALVRRIRPYLWLGMAAVHVGVLVVLDAAEVSLGVLLVHAMTFDPAWIRPAMRDARDLVFYDGHCGLCQGGVRFVLAESRLNDAFTFSPLQGERIRLEVSEAVRASLPDSMIVKTEDGRLLAQSDVVIRLASRLGGLWRLVAIGGRFIPRPIRDAIYSVIAKSRRHLFAKPTDVCPMMPPALRERFVG